MVHMYGMDIDKTPHFTMITYGPDDSLRWSSLLFIILIGCLLGPQYFIIAYCGIKTHFALKTEIAHLSAVHRTLQKQFLHALVAQALVPTILYGIPAIPLLIGPFVDIKWSMESGIFMSLLNVYPAIDSVIFMVIVPEYRKIIRGNTCAKKIFSQPPSCVTISM
uniref:Seven TM Receptor n=1 Tax=Caenorhabditis tropicalis TaxID=1561998 RepID=A0A1I7V2K0_9PELO